MKYQAHRQILLTQFIILLVFMGLTLCNEVLDIPHLLMGDEPTTIGQRTGEVFIEIYIFVMVVLIEILVAKKLFRRIKILEGLLPICANCKKSEKKITGSKWKHIYLNIRLPDFHILYVRIVVRSFILNYSRNRQRFFKHV